MEDSVKNVYASHRELKLESNQRKALYIEGTLHGENFISISFHIEWDMIVVTVILSLLNQMELHLIQNRKGKLSSRSYPIQCERKWKQFSQCIPKG